MGIRVICPDCGKNLNVKSFLAGKRGVCPHCGGKFDIPLNSAKTIEVEDDEDEIRAVPTPAAVALPRLAAVPLVSAPRVPAVAAQQLLRTVARDPIAEAPQANWYVRPPAGGQFGPAQGEVLRQWMQQRRVTPDSYLWREGWPDWQRADVAFPELKGAAALSPLSAVPQPQPSPLPIAAPTVAMQRPAAAPVAQFTEKPAPLAVPASGAMFASPGAELHLSRGTVARPAKAQGSNASRIIALVILVLAIFVLAPLLGYVLMRG